MEGSHGRGDREWRWNRWLNSRGCGKKMVLISCPHTNAERMSMSDGAASLLAAGVHAADEGAGCLERQEVSSD